MSEKHEMLNPAERIKVLTDLLNTSISVPKYTEQKINREMKPVVTGSFEVSPFNDNEIEALKALIFLDIEHYVDNGRMEAKRDELEAKRNSHKAALEDTIKKAEAEELTTQE